MDFDTVRDPRPTPPAFLRCKVTAENADTLTCDILLPDGSSGGELTVAKPNELRQSFYSGNTYDGASYAASTVSSRTADGSVTQNIVPSYRTGTYAAILFAFRPHNGTGVDGVEWQDLNVDGRMWADEPA